MNRRFFILDKFNTWYDWRCTLTSKSVTPAEPKTNYVTIDGCSYLEGTYDEVVGFSDLSVDAWVGDEKVDIYDYIEKNLYY